MKIKYVSYAILCLLLVAIGSCKKENSEANTEGSNTNLSTQISKVETSYKEGDIKIENKLQPGDSKTETSASAETKEKIRLELENSVSKQTTYLKSGSNVVGVIANGSCGQYSTLEIKMDCEDRNYNSSSSGWIGDCSVLGDGNVVLKFCMVYNAFFERMFQKDYAVLDMSNVSMPYGLDEITRYFDNEDKNNINYSKINGVLVAPNTWFGQTNLGTGNTRLGFYYYKAYTSGTNFPNLGISYGVLGRFGSYQGSIYTDDEDDGNANFCMLHQYQPATNTYIDIATGNIPNIMDVGSNTRLYFSKVY